MTCFFMEDRLPLLVDSTRQLTHRYTSFLFSGLVVSALARRGEGDPEFWHMARPVLGAGSPGASERSGCDCGIGSHIPPIVASSPRPSGAPSGRAAQRRREAAAGQHQGAGAAGEADVAQAAQRVAGAGGEVRGAVAADFQVGTDRVGRPVGTVHHVRLLGRTVV